MLGSRHGGRRLTIALALGLAAVAGVLFLAASAPAASASPAPWHVDTTQWINDTTYYAESSITVDNAGNLTIRNSTVLFNLTGNGALSLNVSFGGRLILDHATLRANVSGFYYNFLVSGHLEARYADISDVRGDVGLGGIELYSGDALIENSSIHHNRYYGLFVRGGAPVVRHTTFDANVVAISVLPGASPVLEDLEIRNSTSFALKMSDASPVIRNLTVSGSLNIAIGALGSILDIQGCRITGGPIGLDAAQGTTGTVDGCAFLATGVGVRATDSPVAVRNSTFFSNGLAVNVTRSAVDLSGNEFHDGQLGVRVQEGAAGVFGGEAVNNRFFGAGVGLEMHVSNFFLENNSFDANMTGTRVFHEVSLQIVDRDGTPVRLATVSITAADGAAVFSGPTNETGVVTSTLEEYRAYGNGTRQNLTPHKVHIVNKGAVTETTVNATSDTTERITLAVSAPAETALGISRQALLLIGAVLGVAAALGVVSLRARRRKFALAREERRTLNRRRRGRRRGR